MSTAQKFKDDPLVYVFAYLFPIVTGLIVYFIFGEKDPKLKFYSLQAFVYGIFLFLFYVILRVIVLGLNSGYGTIVLLVGLITLFLWVFGLYVGYEGSKGIKINIPLVTSITNSMVQ
jgi:uncharacterized membrane protein